jgi:hypothetical protein
MYFSPHFLSGFSVPLAYLDPGTGSMILQILLVVLLGVGVVLRLFWSKIKLLFTKSKPDESGVEPGEDDVDDE